MGHPARGAARQPQVPEQRAPRPRRLDPRRRGIKPQRPPQRSSFSPGELLRRVVQLILARARDGEGPPLQKLTRPDWLWAAATAGVSGLLFSTVLTNHPGLGDAPESVSGVMSLGVLHAPGYPVYVLAARLFTLLVPVGGAALRVNLFSLVCASLSIAGVQLLARRCGAPRWTSTLGALSMAATAGFWFYAGFGKHDTFSGLLFLVGLHLCISCAEQPSSRRLIGLGAVFGLGFGSSWPLMVLLLPSAAFALFSSRRRLGIRAAAAGGCATLIVIVGAYGFVMVRASQNPPVNWGGATTLSRLSHLVSRSDFRGNGTPNHLKTPAPGASTPPARSGQTASSFANYGLVFVHELGVLGVALAAIGLLVTLLRRTTAAYLLLITFLTNLIGVAVVIKARSSSFNADLVEEGFILGCYLVLAVWLALGAAHLCVLLRRIPTLERVGRRKLLDPAVGALLAIAVLIPAVSGHWEVAHRAGKPFADRYAQSVFGELPPRAVVFIWGAEFSQPLVYRQVVFHERQDVVVVAADGLGYDWYRQQIGRRLGTSLGPATGNSIPDAASAVQSLRGLRPVFLDPQATEFLAGTLGSRTSGLLAQPVVGSTAALVGSPALMAQKVLAAERLAGLPDPSWNVWPNFALERVTYSTAALKVARAYYNQHDFAQMRSWFRNVLSVEPRNKTAQRDLAATGG